MALWKASLSSGEALGTALVAADSCSEAKSIIFNQFLGLEKSSIVWYGQPSFWVLCLSLQPEHQQEAYDED
jgi:hypothetical protein